MAALMLWACVPEQITPIMQPTLTLTPRAAASPTQGPENALGFEELFVLPGEDQNQWQVIALVSNSGIHSLTDLLIEISAYDAEGQLLGVRPLPINTGTLPPESHTAFLTLITSSVAVTHVEARALSATIADDDSEAPAIEIDFDDMVFTPPEQTLAAGTLTNASEDLLIIDSLIFLARRPDGTLLAAADSYTGLHSLLPGEMAAFVTPLHGLQADASFEAFPTVHLSSDTTSPPLVFLQAPALSFDDQEHPIVTAYIQNEGETPYWANLVVTLMSGNEAVGIAQTRLPAPIPPGESRPVILRSWLPLQSDTRISPSNAAQFTLQAQFDPTGSTPADHYPRPLTISLDYYEQIGNLLILRGSLFNPWSLTLAQPSALVTIRSTSGDVLTGTWQVLAPSIGSNATIEFQLSIPLPAQLDAAMSEYDLQACGLIP
ncbi:MAG: hypothetical protein JXA97_03560 [Anaerolineales bacterium]|nr:hypothetical protein [Anaerolineales bacterium]